MNSTTLTIKCFSSTKFITKLIAAMGIVSLLEGAFEWSIAMFIIALVYGSISSYLHKEFIKSSK